MQKKQDSFNSRPHKEVDAQIAANATIAAAFQFTTSQGGRRPTEDGSDNKTSLSIHDLTRRSTDFFFSSRCSIIFQFTTSQGGRLTQYRQCHRNGSFNSRPHKEVDIQDTDGRRVELLSIHDLTRRSTR